MAQITKSLAQAILNGSGYTDNEVKQLAYACLKNNDAQQTEAPQGYETRHAIMEGERNASADEYFKARPQLDFIGNRRIFEAGFQRGFERTAQTEAPVNVPSGWSVSVQECDDESILRIQSPEGQMAVFTTERGSFKAQVLQDFGIALAAAPAPVQTKAQQGAKDAFKPRELATLNGAQLHFLAESAQTDGKPDPETEITLIEHSTPFKSTDGEDMPAGIYFYWTEYPEEGIVLIDAIAKEKAK